MTIQMRNFFVLNVDSTPAAQHMGVDNYIIHDTSVPQHRMGFKKMTDEPMTKHYSII